MTVVIYREIKGRKDVETLQKDLDSWAKLNKIKINNRKSKAVVSFTKKRLQDALEYKIDGETTVNTLASISTVNCGGRSRKTKLQCCLHFVMGNLKKGNAKSKEMAYLSLVMEYGEQRAGTLVVKPIRIITGYRRKRAAKFIKIVPGNGNEKVKLLGWDARLQKRRERDTEKSLLVKNLGRKSEAD